MSTIQSSKPQAPTTSQAANYSFHPIVTQLLKKRGMGQEEVKEFMSWSLVDLPDMTQMKDVDKAAKRIELAIENKEKVGIYGDYDVDGTTSCALFYHFFKMLQLEVELIQPSRFIEGYGLHLSSIDDAKKKEITLLITVDCGITNNEAADYARENDIDLIITDHHKDARDEMPAAFAVVNPNRRDEPEDSPLKVLAGVAVAFAVCVQVRKNIIAKGQTLPSLYSLLQFVAVGTICDLAKLTSVNLKLVRHGLKQITESQYKGLRSFFSTEERERKFVPSEKLSFHIGPLINSKGRLDHPEKALQLLTTDDSKETFEFYNQLDICNQERKFIQSQVYTEAKKQVLERIDDDEHLISIVYKSEWHEGVIGIVASKLVENFKVPAIVFTDSEEKGIIKASARSAGDLDIFDCLQQNNHLFKKFGGHKAAAGLSMDKENLPAFKENITALLKEMLPIQRTVQVSYDLELDPSDITPQLVRDLEKLEPFGMGNQKPLFKLSNLKLDSYKILKEVHARFDLSSLINPKQKFRGISFNYVGKWNCLTPEELFTRQGQSEYGLTAYFTVGINRFKGNEYLQLMIDRFEV